MQKLSDFKPLSRLSLPDLGELECAGLIVVVGSNSSGKSQLLHDLHKRLVGEPRALVVASSLRVEKPPFEQFLDCLVAEGYFTRSSNGADQLRPLTTYLGSGQAVSSIQVQQAKTWHDAFNPDHEGPSEFLQQLGRVLVTGLFLDRRLVSLGPVGLIDFQAQTPQHDLHALHLNDSAQAKLSEEMRTSFGRDVWSDTSQGTTISLKVSEVGQFPSDKDRRSVVKMTGVRSVESEGDGMKSYLATCLALLLGRRPVCLIDEPEMCLHPPQANNLGRFIGRFGASTDTTTVVATHSSHLLRGIIQTATKVQIVRLTRPGRRFSAHSVPASELKEAMLRPTLRAEAILDGIFSQAVVVVEAEGDRLVYQTVWETLRNDAGPDIHFAVVSGIGGIAETCRFYRTLRVPVAVIADIDLLVDANKFQSVLSALLPDLAARSPLLQEGTRLRNELRRVLPLMSPEEVVAELAAISAAPMSWADDDDKNIKGRLQELASGVDRARRLKERGTASLPEGVDASLIGLLERLNGVGLFLAPVGDLEQWLAAEALGVSKTKKWAWADAAARRIAERGKQDGDVWDFVEAVGRYLAQSDDGSPPA